MKTTWIFFLAVGIVSADIGLGYHYKVPQTSYGTPSYQFNGNSGQYSSALNSGLGSGSFYKGGSGYQNGGLSSSGLGSDYYQSSSGSSNVLRPINYYTGNNVGSSGFQSQYSSSSQFQSAAQEKYQHSYEIQQQAPVVYKHFYVHAAPEEPEQPKQRTPIVLPPAQKHYKIIFVKVPSEGQRNQAVIPVQQQNEEKTIVYVLLKKPEDNQELIVPKVDQKPPSKPEVFFIKYKNKEDSQTVIDNIVKDYNKGQNVVTTNVGGTGGNTFSTASGVGASGNTFNTASGLGTSGNTFNTASGLGTGGNTFSTASGLGTSGNTFNTVSSVGDTSFNGFGNVQYDSPVNGDASADSQSFQLNGNQGTSFNSGVDLLDLNLVSSVAPITVSSTASSGDYDGASAISTSQGVPYETYGPPKFRVD